MLALFEVVSSSWLCQALEHAKLDTPVKLIKTFNNLQMWDSVSKISKGAIILIS